MPENGGSLDESLALRIEKLNNSGILRRRNVSTELSTAFCSNDYLGFGSLAPMGSGPGGARGSRLICTDGQEIASAETALADWLGVQSVLLFSSGYAANVGTIAALAGPDELIVSDALNHASIVDGCRLSRATIAVVPHLDLGAMDQALASRPAGARWVVTESYFSMDADGPDCGALGALCAKHGAFLMVDEAHAVGVLGPGGRGRFAEAGVVPDVLVGTLGKAFGLAGAFVAGSRRLTEWLWNRARSFVFSTGFSPWLAAAASERVGRVAAADDLRALVLSRSQEMRAELLARAGSMVPGFGPIVPWRFPSPAAALRAQEVLADCGFRVPAIRPPTVAPGTERLRLTVTAGSSDAHVRELLQAIDAVVRECFT